MNIAVLMKDVEYSGVTHRKGTGWTIERGTAYIRDNIVYVIAGYGETIDLVIGKDVYICSIENDEAHPNPKLVKEDE